jgi:hypothetical protein
LPIPDNMLQTLNKPHAGKAAAASHVRPDSRRSAPFGTCRPSRQPARVAAVSTNSAPVSTSRRDTMFLLTSTLGSMLMVRPSQAAFTLAPPGYRAHLDRLDGYNFTYPEDWAPVTSSGNDIFLRNPFNIDENLFVDISSPSSSRYKSVEDLGTPEAAAQKLLDQYLNQEFMSTRIGVRREGKVMSANSRVGADGKVYFDLDIRMTSYASRNPYVATQAEVMSQYGVEWDRRLLTTLGAANNRLYQLRLQTGNETFDQRQPLLQTIQQSFKCREVEEL